MNAVWKFGGDFLDFRSDGKVYMLPSEVFFARWECVSTGNIKVYWGPSTVNYTLSDNGNTFTDGESTGVKINGTLGSISWQQSNGTTPTNAVIKGNRPICRCTYNGGQYIGQLINKRCQFAVEDGSEKSSSQFEVLTSTGPLNIRWVQSAGWKYPKGLLTAGSQTDRSQLSVGAVQSGGQLIPGWVTWQPEPTLHYGSNGLEKTTTDFMWLSIQVVEPNNQTGQKSPDLMKTKSGEKKKSGVIGIKNNR